VSLTGGFRCGGVGGEGRERKGGKRSLVFVLFYLEELEDGGGSGKRWIRQALQFLYSHPFLVYHALALSSPPFLSPHTQTPTETEMAASTRKNSCKS